MVDPFTGLQVEQLGPLPYADITDPQTLNKYVYVRNNPLRFVDPDGHCDKSPSASGSTKCQDVKKLSVNETGLTHLRLSEGLQNQKGDPRLDAYLLAGDLLVGYGHKVTSEDNLKLGSTITKEQAEKFLVSDVNSAGQTIKKAVGNLQLSQGEFNALTDLVFNVGPAVLTTAKSPKLMDAILDWNGVGPRQIE